MRRLGVTVAKEKKMSQTENDVHQWSAGAKRMSRLALLVLAFFMLVVAMPTGAAAEDTAQKDGWQFEANVYLWASSIDVTTPRGNDISVSFSDLVKNLKFGVAGGVGARYGRWSLMTDAMYMKLKHDGSGQVTEPAGPGGSDITANATVDVAAWLVTPTLGYSIVDTDRVRVDIFAGARYFWLKPELDLNITGTVQPRSRQFIDSGTVWDGIGGIRGNVSLDKNWYIPYYVDMGTGGSTFTWQGWGGIGYKFSKLDVVAAYRYLYWKFDDNKVVDTLSFSGPAVGMVFRF
ncbi:MAG: hypothetical protein ABR903_01565 [Thermodesulfovibrionales bacterium]|jgi:hypothetical protein